MKTFHLHLVSDSTAETANTVARACMGFFEQVTATEHVWSMVRYEDQMDEIISGIKLNPGFVLYTMVDHKLAKILVDSCRKIQAPCLPILDPVVVALGEYLGVKTQPRPGRQHVTDAEYFNRIEAMQFALNHDDGQTIWSLEQSDVIILGVSRTSKTPTCIYLANRGIKAANIPIVPGCPLPPEIDTINAPLIVGLTKDPKRLVQIRRNRLKMLNQDEETDYVDLETVSNEINGARRLFAKNNWPVINVTGKSIEETAATILQLYNRRKEMAT